MHARIRTIRRGTGSGTGTTVVEYGLLVAAIAAVIVVVVFALSGFVRSSGDGCRAGGDGVPTAEAMTDCR